MVQTAHTTDLLKTIQREQLTWRRYNFPKSKSWHPLLGMAEEVGELSEAILGNKGSDTELDAVCDVMIYLIDFCNFSKINLQKLVDAEIHSPDHIQIYSRHDATANIKLTFLTHMVQRIGRIHRAHLKSTQGIYKNQGHQASRDQAIAQLVVLLLDFCNIIHHQHLFDVLTATWDQVKARDFQSNALTGGRTDIMRELYDA